MKKYRVEAISVCGYICDLANIDDPTDRLYCEPNQFQVGEVLTENEFKIEVVQGHSYAHRITTKINNQTKIIV